MLSLQRTKQFTLMEEKNPIMFSAKQTSYIFDKNMQCLVKRMRSKQIDMPF